MILRKVSVVYILACVCYGSALRQSNETGTLLKEKPSWLLSCKKSDPKLNQCLKKLFEGIFPQLAKGIDEIDVQRFEPLHLRRVSVSKGAGAVTLSGSLYNLLVHGPSQAVTTYTDLNLPENKFNFGIDLPILDIDSQYNLVGKILILPLVGNGPCKLVLKNVRTAISTNFEMLGTPDGRQVMHIKNMKVNFKVGHMHVKLENLFNGNKVLGMTVNNFLNQNGLEVIGELSDSIADSLATIFIDLMNKIFLRIPTDLWLTDD